jgi:hypothetical protein
VSFDLFIGLTVVDVALEELEAPYKKNNNNKKKTTLQGFNLPPFLFFFF